MRKDSVLDLNRLAASMSIQEWIALILTSADETVRDARVPRLPAADIQMVTNACHGSKTLEGAAKLYAFVAHEVRSRFPGERDLKLLDFGCGWGRFARF